MDNGFDTSPNLAGFLHSEDESIFYDEDLRPLRDDAAFRERLQELEQPGDDRSSASSEAWIIRSTIKDEISRSGKLATHDGSDQPIGIELPAGSIAVAPDGTVTQGHRPEHLSLTQLMLRDVVGIKNLRLSKNRGGDAHSSLLPSSSQGLSSTKPATCPTCACLQDVYGKTTLQELRRSQDRCKYCQLVVQILEFYKSGLDGENRVRIFAPLTKNDTLRICCQCGMARESEIPFMIEVFDLPSHRPLYPPIKPAADISGDTSSPEAFAKARYWLQHCVDDHKGCASNTNVRLPTRLVRIRRDPFTHLTTIKLIETNSSFGRYACLSHCWGPQGSSGLLRTTSANYEAHLNAIPIQSLPRTFQHALITTRRLGLDLIWIDSLCIIQGDEADWTREAARMGSYYSSGYVTISASWSPRPSGGCFNLSEPEFIGRRLPIPDSFNSVSVRRVLDHGSRWPLLHRGWVFQERMLSPRVLHFGLREIVWECLTCTACECGMSDALQAELSNKREYTQAMGNTERDRLKDAWRDMVQQYSGLDLTFASDRFAAIAGVAKQMQGYRHANYFAGLWEDSMIGDMLWRSFRSPGEQMKPRNEGNKAPTWSWASVEAPWITYEHLGTRLGARGRTVSFERIEDTYAKILSISGEPLADGSFGDSELGAIIIQGSCIRGRVVHRPLHQPPSSDIPARGTSYSEWYEARKHELKAEIVLDDGYEPRFHTDYGLNGRRHMIEWD
ncbi:uncharacterized protein NECHADRAFT_82410 [Fusarium vanettenii 77-13-4]|uniref:Heterokaryon incompatibility domain-containing protein n=1 Tax=Fusarium vanettenii (strain ATCC MYA-4622 / CBS 123669 / FGSC 9596 / NRRL 45880 / 77-13-4) TaxID=660122 RepID=C7ZMK7_FUSV7|nr:uncharacterized protein NECHADRAFT_82410 [Fusarium vanettenii 77-13-4]EEU34768.1 hypothetical protein NECHADRAFT_82410 [Fusarium vanettenii 77-13-4]